VTFDDEIFVVVWVFNCMSVCVELCFPFLQLLIKVQEFGSWSMMSLKQSMNLFKTYLLVMNKLLSRQWSTYTTSLFPMKLV